MKKLLIPIIALLAFSIFYSCKKETVTVNNTIIDTVCVEPTKREVLVEKLWQIEELVRSFNGVTSKYVRGGTNTTRVNYGNLTLKFNDDGSGSYVDEAGTSHTLVWNFTTANQRNASLTIGPPSPSTFEWSMIEIEDNYLHSTTAFGSNLLITARYMQVP